MNTRANATDKLTLTADNHDLGLFGHRALQHGTTLDVRWGYAGNLSQPRRMFLEDFRGFSELELVFSGHERPLNAEAKTRSWIDRGVVDVVGEIARENGFFGAFLHVEACGHAPRHFSQTAETDAAFLQRLAAEYGREFFIDAAGFHWQRPRKADVPLRDLYYFGEASTILSIDCTSNLARQVGRVEVRGRDPMQRTTISASTTGAGDRPTLADSVEVIDPKRYVTARQKDNARASIHPTGAPSQNDAQREAAARFGHNENQAIELRLIMIGIPSLVARNLVRLADLPPFLRGNYYIAEATHTLGSTGYTTDLRLTRDGGGFREGEAVAQQGGTQNRQEPAGAADRIDIIDVQRYEEHRGE